MPEHKLAKVMQRIRQTVVSSDGPSNAQLLDRFVATRDETAFEVLLRRHERMVFGVCRRQLNDYQDAENAFQAVFLALARQASRISRKDALAGWLHRVAYRVAVRLRQRNSKQAARERPLAAVEMAPDCASTEGSQISPELHELRLILDEELNRLPARFRLPLVLCYLDGRSVEQAAAQLRCPRGTVASRLARGRSLLAVRLTRRGVIVPATGLSTALTLASQSTGAPQVLVTAAMKVVSLCGTGAAASAAAVTLAGEVIRAMTFKKAIMAATMLLSMGLLLVGGGLGLQRLGGTAPEIIPPGNNAPAPIQPPVTETRHKSVPAPAPGPSRKVTVMRPVPRDNFVPFQNFSGRLEAAAVVEIVPQVSGRLQKIDYRPGSTVKKGDVLFEIEDTSLQEKVERAAANLAAAEARYRSSEVQVKQLTQHVKQGLVSTEQVAKAVSAADVHRAGTRVAQVDFASARRELAAATIKATTSGTISEPKVPVGAGLTADKTVLATISRMDPLQTVFDMDERSFARYQRLKRQGELSTETGEFSVEVGDEDNFPHKGATLSFGTHFDPRSGAIEVRGTIPNPDGRLLPGMFARIRMPFGKARSGLEIPEEAIGVDHGQRYVFVVNPDNLVERRTVKTNYTDGQISVIESGVKADDWVVINRVQGLVPGTRVEPNRIRIAAPER